jgi:hypothetical protein
LHNKVRVRLRVGLSLVLISALMLLPAAARAAEPSTAAPASGPRLPLNALIYEHESKSTAGAVALEMLFPGLGTLYAEDHRGALITWGLIAGGFAAVPIHPSRWRR